MEAVANQFLVYLENVLAHHLGVCSVRLAVSTYLAICKVEIVWADGTMQHHLGTIIYEDQCLFFGMDNGHRSIYVQISGITPCDATKCVVG